MAIPNNITKNWESVLRTAEIELVVTVNEANSLAQNSVVPLFDRKSILEQQVAAAKAQIAAAIANNQNTTSLQSTLTRLESQLSTVTRDYNTFNSTLLQLENKARSLRTQINEAKSQIATQAAKTTPATNNTIAATVTPASANPGNPNVATTTPTTNISAPRPANTNVTNTTNTTSTAATTVVTTPNSVTVITEETTTTTSGGSRTITVPATVSDPATVSASLITSESLLTPVTGPVTIDLPQFDEDGNFTGNNQVTLEVPPTTTNPSNSLPLGADIEDIYDPNLTPEQVASLSPEDQEVRAEVLAAVERGGLAEVGPNGEIVVTGTRRQADAFRARKDWRVRLALSDDASVNYLYKATDPGILEPLLATNGVIFPYTPTISVNYSASYNPTELVHSNYKVYQYSSSSIDSITIACDFTAQDIRDANYLLAVIHFFRSATKMFYGQDENPRRGTPPPLCYIYGMGSYQFAGQPLAISQFSYNLPNNVDYIKTTATPTVRRDRPSRLTGTGANPGGVNPPPDFTSTTQPDNVSWVPSKIQLSITCVPMMNRNAVSNEFSLKDYATGALLNGIGTRSGGFW
jgi:hypothetical protein